jgi:hypothetical protein
MVALASKKPDGGTWSRLELQEKVLGTGPEAAGYKIGSDFRNIETRLLDALAHVASGYVVRMTDDDEGHEKQVRAAIQEAWQKSRSLVVTIKVEPGHGVLLPGDKDFGSGKAKSGERARRPAVG